MKDVQKEKREIERVLKRMTETYLFDNIRIFTVSLETCIKNLSIFFFKKKKFYLHFSINLNRVFRAICFVFPQEILQNMGLVKNLYTRRVYFKRKKLKNLQRGGLNDVS